MHQPIDFTATFKKLRAAFVLYNDKLKSKHPERYRKESLKSTHMETARELIRCYAAHILKPGQLQIERPKSFHVSNKGVGKNKLQHRTTIYRHILVLGQTGIVTNKTFHGSSRGIEIELNQQVLVYKKDPNDIGKEVRAEIQRLDSRIKENVASCHDKDAVYLQEAFNINKGGGYVDKEKMGKSGMGTPKCPPQTQAAVPLPLDTAMERSVPQKRTWGVAGDDPNFSEIIDFYAKQAWSFARSVLYFKNDLSDMQERLALMYVREYFSLIKHEIFKRNFVDRLFNDFCERIILAKRYIDRSPERFIPVPSVWFNKHFRNGFCGTLAWLNKVRANRIALSGYIKKLSGLCSIYRQYLSDANVHSYYVSLKKVEALGDPTLVEYFNYCVVDKSRFDVGYLRNYYKFFDNGN